MPRFHDTDPESVDRRLREVAEEERRQGGVVRRAILWLAVWIATGIGLMAWGFQMDDQLWGPTIFLAGAALGNAGIVGTLVWAYRRREEE